MSIAKSAAPLAAHVPPPADDDSELSDVPELHVRPATAADASASSKKPRKRASKTKAAAATARAAAAEADGAASDDDHAAGAAAAPPPKKRARKTKAAKAEADAAAQAAAEAGPVVLHEVAHRDFSAEGGAARGGAPFTGRLGYACLNTILRSAKPAPVFSSRTLRLKTLREQGAGAAHALARANAADIVPMLEWNARHGIRFMRLSSEMCPFASHKEHGYSPTAVAGEQLKAAGDRARELGIRLTMHPGQFTQLGSPKDDIIEAAIRELAMHCDILDGMGVGPDGVLIVHGGGTYGDRPATLARIAHTIEHRLPPHVRARVVLENDEMAYAADELLPLCERLDVPLVLDFHHDLLRPSAQPPAELLTRINAIWARRGIKPKYHLSEGRPGAATLRERRAHSDRCLRLPADLPADADLMIEAKDKEQAVLELMRIYRLVDEEAIARAVRPPAGARLQGMQGAGKKAVLVKKDYAGVKPAAAGAPGEDGDDASEPSASGASPPKKRRENEADMSRRVLQRARALAKAKGRVYTGPGANVHFSDDEDAPPARDEDMSEAAQALRAKRAMSQDQVYADMLVRAEEIRAHLRATGRRLKYDGNGIEGDADADADAAADEDAGEADGAAVVK